MTQSDIEKAIGISKTVLYSYPDEKRTVYFLTYFGQGIDEISEKHLRYIRDTISNLLEE